MKLSTIAVFGAGYVLGSKAGRERYVQIVELAQRTAQRVEERQAARARSDGQRSGDS